MELKPMLAYLSKKGRFHVSPRKYCYIKIWAKMQVKHIPGFKLQNPTNQSMPVSLPWIIVDRQLLHERIKDERQH